MPQLGSSTEPKPRIPQTPAGQVLQGPFLRARQPNWALINPSLALIPVSEPSSPLVVEEGTGALLALTCGVEGCWGCGRIWALWRGAQKCQGCPALCRDAQHCAGMLGGTRTQPARDPSQHFPNCFLKGPGGLSKSVELQSNRGGSLGGFISIDFVRSCCILLHLKTRLWNNFERLTRTQKAAF